jgi:hypothetical protein
LSIPLVADKGIDDIIYDDLVNESQINPQIGASFLKHQYLKNHRFVETANLFESMLRTPGERRPTNRGVLEYAIVDGVIRGEFGLGELDNEIPIPKFFKKHPTVSFDPGEVLIQASLCEEEPIFVCDKCGFQTSTKEEYDRHIESHKEESPKDKSGKTDSGLNMLEFGFTVPEGQINNIGQMLLKIASHYRSLKLKVEASDGKMTQHDLELIKETLRQIGAYSDLL